MSLRRVAHRTACRQYGRLLRQSLKDAGDLLRRSVCYCPTRHFSIWVESSFTSGDLAHETDKDQKCHRSNGSSNDLSKNFAACE